VCRLTDIQNGIACSRFQGKECIGVTAVHTQAATLNDKKDCAVCSETIKQRTDKQWEGGISE
jgi:hypothetical protein